MKAVQTVSQSAANRNAPKNEYIMYPDFQLLKLINR